MVEVRSSPASNRDRTCRKAKADAASMISPAAGCSTPIPGRITTSAPRNPTVTAAQRRMPTGSRRISAPMTVTMNGATKVIATASASGT